MLRQTDFLKAMLLDACWFWGAPHGYPAMEMIGWCIGNRVRSGWGSWSQVLSNLPETGSIDYPELQDRLLVRMLPDPYHPNYLSLSKSIDSIFDNTTRDITNGGHYWADLPGITRPWFREHILNQQKDHPRVAQNGTFVVWE